MAAINLIMLKAITNNKIAPDGIMTGSYAFIDVSAATT